MKSDQTTSPTDDIYLPYSFLERDGERVVKMFCDPPQIMTSSELSAWMRELRNEHPLLYSQVVPIYVALRKSS